MTGGADSERVLILAPLGRDAELAAEVLREAGLEGIPCEDVDALLGELDEGAGALLLTEEALDRPALEALTRVVQRQPPWSDLPVLVFGSRLGADGCDEPLAGLGNVVRLDRPTRTRVVVSALCSALRGRRRQYAARRAIEQRDRFLAMLGHELRTPLGAILFASQLLTDRTPEGEGGGYAGVIARQVRHLGRLVDDLLDVARIESDKIVLERSIVDLRPVVEQALETLRGRFESEGLAATSELPSAPVPVNADPVRLEQVLHNLLGNAIKYTPRGGSVRVSLAADDHEARLEVRDTGAGIPADVLPHVFELFAQEDGAVARKSGGLGIGLGLVRSLVALHGGRVEAHSPGPGQGAVFTVHLPLDEAPAEEVAPPPAPGRLTGREVVIVEDSDDIRQTLTELLALSGCVVTPASNGPDGLSLILHERPSVAVVDIGLPGLDGLELAARVRREAGEAVRLVALSGYGQPEDRRRAEAAGFDAYLTKPVDLDALFEALG